MQICLHLAGGLVVCYLVPLVFVFGPAQQAEDMLAIHNIVKMLSHKRVRTARLHP